VRTGNPAPRNRRPRLARLGLSQLLIACRTYRSGLNDSRDIKFDRSFLRIVMAFWAVLADLPFIVFGASRNNSGTQERTCVCALWLSHGGAMPGSRALVIMGRCRVSGIPASPRPDKIPM
jgi:hypothetical protein